MASLWYEEFLARPWEGVPSPPESFNCGELLRYVFLRDFGHLCAPIPVQDARDLRGCLDSMTPPYYGLHEVPEAEAKEKDGVFMARRKYVDHCGLLVVLPNGERRVLHCAPRGGVQLSTFLELRSLGYTSFSFWRPPEGGACEK